MRVHRLLNYYLGMKILCCNKFQNHQKRTENQLRIREAKTILQIKYDRVYWPKDLKDNKTSDNTMLFKLVSITDLQFIT